MEILSNQAVRKALTIGFIAVPDTVINFDYDQMLVGALRYQYSLLSLWLHTAGKPGRGSSRSHL